MLRAACVEKIVVIVRNQKKSSATIETYGLLPKKEIIRKALIAKKNHSSVFCIALSGTRPSKKRNPPFR